MKVLKFFIAFVIATLVNWGLAYLLLPPMNFSAPSFWWFMLLAALVCAAAFGIAGWYDEEFVPAFISLGAAALALIILTIGGCIGAKMFNSKAYANLLNVSNTTFEEQFANVNWNSVPHIDHASSAILGDRKMGTLVDEVSQYNVSGSYTLINQNGKPIRVAPLKYSGIFKYFNNKYQGIPGYITVDCVEKAAEFIRLEKGIQYSPSAFFSKNLERHIRNQFPSKLFDEISFEINDEGTPYWVIPTYEYTLGIGGGKSPNGCILTDPVSGDSIFYSLQDIPEWIDHAIDDDTMNSLVVWWGKYQGGWWNSFMSQKNVRQPTEGNAFITIGNDVYLYTGITSVAMDESNIGFILINQRTAEAKYFEMPSAEEYSAMDSAKGQVQHLNYSSTFPILINLDGHPTYFLSLKDAAGLVKMYALVSVGDIQKLAVTEASKGIEYLVEEYSKAIGTNKEEEVEYKTKTFTITNIYSVVVGGNTQFYFEDTKGNIYMTDISKSIKLPVLTIGDRITVTYTETEVKGYYSVANVK